MLLKHRENTMYFAKTQGILRASVLKFPDSRIKDIGQSVKFHIFLLRTECACQVCLALETSSIHWNLHR